MENIIRKKDFRGLMLGISVVIAGIHFVGFSFLLIIMITEWVLLIYLLCLLPAQSKKEKKALSGGAAGFFGEFFIRPIKSFDSIVKESRPYLLMARFKWVVGLFLLLATIFYILSLLNVSLIHPLFAEVKIVSLSTLATIFLGITLGFIILMMWFESNFPMLRWARASFYNPPLEEREGMEIAKSCNKAAGHEEVIIVRQEKGYLLVPHAFLTLTENTSDSPGKLRSGKILLVGEEPVLSHLKLKKGDIKKDLTEEKPIVIC